MEAFILVCIICFVIFVAWLRLGIIIVESTVKIFIGLAWMLLILLIIGMIYDVDILIELVLAVFKAFRYIVGLILHSN
ncbi:MAG: hypothetical protein AAGG75_26835 [Bacteroidota bacterium]